MMRPAVYTPRKGSVALRAIAFFKANPGEELTSNDVAVKFSVSHHSVHPSLKPAVDAGLLAKVRRGKEVAYRLPDLINETEAAAA